MEYCYFAGIARLQHARRPVRSPNGQEFSVAAVGDRADPGGIRNGKPRLRGKALQGY
jgi:hypothetical protein